MAAGEIGQQGGYGSYSDDDENSNNQALGTVMTQSFILWELCVCVCVCMYVLSMYWFTFHVNNMQKTISFKPAVMKEGSIWNSSLIATLSHFIQHIMNHPFK